MEHCQWSPLLLPKGSQGKSQLGGSSGVTEVNTMRQNFLISRYKSSSFDVFLLSRKHTRWREIQWEQTRLNVLCELETATEAASELKRGSLRSGGRSG